MPASSRLATTLLAAVLGVATVGCANPALTPQPAPSVPGVQFGQVETVDVLCAEGQTTGVGALLGGLVGAYIARRFGDGSGSVVAAGVGAAGGAFIGNEIEKQQRRGQDLQRVVVRLDSGMLRSFDLPGGAEWRVGDRVGVQDGEVVRQ